jgi:hypothetical protein
MKKPLIFALRGAAGFSLTALLMIIGLAWAEMIRDGALHNRSGLALLFAIGIFLFSGTLGATVLFYGTDNWIRAALGSGLFFSVVLWLLFIVIMMARGVGPDGPTLDEAVTIVVIWAFGHATYAGIGACFKRLALAYPAMIAFGLPGLILGTLAMMTHYQGSLLWFFGMPVSGALFGFFVGRSEDQTRPTPLPPD